MSWTNPAARACAVLLPALSLAGCESETEVSETPARAERAAVSAVSPIPLTVHERAGVARSREVVRSGVPLSRALGVTSASQLAVVDAAGAPVPAEFSVLARWDAARTSSAPIQWVLATFPASVGAGGQADYRLVVDGSVSNPAPARPLAVSQSGSRVTVDTGAARFTVGPDGIFEDARDSAGQPVVAGGRLEGRAEGRDLSHPTVRQVRIEHQGPLSAVVTVTGAYDMPKVAGGGLSTLRRYVFTAGSPTAVVRHAVAWEGNRCGDGVIDCGGQPNGVLVERLRDAFTLSASGTKQVRLLADRQGGLDSGSVAAGQSAALRQRLRSQRTAPYRFEAAVPGRARSGSHADGGVLAVTAEGRTLAVALDHMHQYEPQALRVLPDGRVAVDVADDRQWISSRSGFFARMAVSALSGTPDRAALDEQVWAPLNAPLRAWPSAAAFAASGAVESFPVGPLPARFAGYDAAMQQALDGTLQQRMSKGVTGLSVFGSLPRYWQGALSADELDCGSDPTPGERWDDMYWCASWTDYHNTTKTAPIRAMRTGEVQYFDEIGVPGALRMLHTQIMQCSPSDGYFYCGQAPAGYGGFRVNFNSSHAYFDNLFLYYWLTGDEQVVRTVERGASSMRDYLCDSRPQASCGPTDVASDPWAWVAGRSASQWISAFRFVGLASDDAGYLDDFRDTLARAFSQHYVQATQGGEGYGFFTHSQSRITGPGSYRSDQLWMASLYDFDNLWRLALDTQDATIGSPSHRPKTMVTDWARTLETFGATAIGDGTAGGRWPNQLDFAFSGSKASARLGSVGAATGGSDPYLYETGKASLVAVMARAGAHAQDASMTAMADRLAQDAIAYSLQDRQPLGKVQGELLARLHSALAVLTGGVPTAPAPTPAPDAGTSTPDAGTSIPDAGAPLDAGTSTPDAGTSTPDAGTTPDSGATPDDGTSAGQEVLRTTVDDVAALTAPQVGPAGRTTLGSGDFAAGRVGAAGRFAGGTAAYDLSASSLSALFEEGEIELWYRPDYGAGDADDASHVIFSIGDAYAPPAIVLEESDAFRLTVRDAGWSSHSVSTRWRQPVWTAGQWVRLRAVWDRDAADPLRLYVDGQRVDQGGGSTWPAGLTPPVRKAVIGARDEGGGAPADGHLDALVLRDGQAPVTAPTPEPEPAPEPSPPQAILHSTMDDPTAVTQPAVGPAGRSSLSGGDFVAGRTGGAARFFGGDTAAYDLTAAQARALLDRGEIELWYRPSYGAGDANDAGHTIAILGNPNNPPALILEESDALRLGIRDAGWTTRSVSAGWRQPVWRAGQWVHLRAVWDRSAADPMQLYVDGQRVDQGGGSTWPAGLTPPRRTLVIGAAAESGGFPAEGVIDDLTVR